MGLSIVKWLVNICKKGGFFDFFLRSHSIGNMTHFLNRQYLPIQNISWMCSNTILWNIKRTWTLVFEHWTTSNMFIYWWSNSNTLFLASNDRTSNFEPNRAFTRFTKSLIQLTRTSLFRTNLNMFIYWYSNSNTLFLASNNRTSNFEHCSTHHYLLLWVQIKTRLQFVDKRKSYKV